MHCFLNNRKMMRRAQMVCAPTANPPKGFSLDCENKSEGYQANMMYTVLFLNYVNVVYTQHMFQEIPQTAGQKKNDET